MRKRIFIDTDVIIDFLIDRKPFSDNANEIFIKGEKRELKLYASSLCFNNIFYITRRLIGEKEARNLLFQLEKITEVLPVDKSIIRTSLKSKFKDFEDGVQNYCAKKAGIKIIVTRDKKDYRESDLSIYSPEEFLKSY